MTKPSNAIAWCSLSIILALQVVGLVSHTSLRHVVQTLPLWVPIALGFRGRALAKWAALTCLVFWLGIMVLIWLFLLGWARIVSGRFSPTEIAMTIVIGVACLAGLATVARWQTAVSVSAAVGVSVLFAILQAAAFWISLMPEIASR